MGGWVGKVCNNQDFSSDGVTLRAGYGLTYYLNEKTSITSGLDFVRNGVSLGCSGDYDFFNGKEDLFSFLHVPFILKYHLHPRKDSNQKLIIGIGPTLNFTLNADSYKFSEWADFQDLSIYQQYKNVLDGKKKIKTFNIGIQPTIMYQFNHVGVGIEANFGLLNMSRKYNVDTGKKIIFEIWPTFSYQF